MEGLEEEAPEGTCTGGEERGGRGATGKALKGSDPRAARIPCPKVGTGRPPLQGHLREEARPAGQEWRGLMGRASGADTRGTVFGPRSVSE